MPLAFTLALIAGILNFVPYIGPLVSAVPAVLLALLQGPQVALYVALLYLGAQTIESYVLTPLVQQRAISLPPALTLSAQTLLGVLLGILGVVLATPLAAITLVVIRKLYVEDALGDKEADKKMAA